MVHHLFFGGRFWSWFLVAGRWQFPLKTSPTTCRPTPYEKPNTPPPPQQQRPRVVHLARRRLEVNKEFFGGDSGSWVFHERQFFYSREFESSKVGDFDFNPAGGFKCVLSLRRSLGKYFSIWLIFFQLGWFKNHLGGPSKIKVFIQPKRNV